MQADQLRKLKITSRIWISIVHTACMYAYSMRASTKRDEKSQKRTKSSQFPKADIARIPLIEVRNHLKWVN